MFENLYYELDFVAKVSVCQFIDWNFLRNISFPNFASNNWNWTTISSVNFEVESSNLKQTSRSKYEHRFRNLIRRVEIRNEKFLRKMSTTEFQCKIQISPKKWKFEIKIPDLFANERILPVMFVRISNSKIFTA